MSKGNLLLGYGRGALGDLVLSHYKGEQIARARNRKPKNPQTTLQMIQRVILKTCSQAYKFFYPLANHSFEGAVNAPENQAIFNQLNVADRRMRFNAAFSEGFDGSWDTNPEIARQHNYSFKDQMYCPVNDYVLSRGTLRAMNAIIHGTTASDIVCVVPFIQDSGEELTIADQSYESVIRGLGIKEGDQLTFVMCSVDDKIDFFNPSEDYRQGTFQELMYYRVIFSPYNENPPVETDVPFINEATVEAGFGSVQYPNPRNRDIGIRFGILGTSASLPYGGLAFISEDMSMSAATHSTTMAVACIHSRRVGNNYLRSTERLFVRPDDTTSTDNVLNTNLLHHTLYMGQAVDSYSTDVYSPLYLNQASWMGL